ncbi:MAG: hypothetical protein ACI9UA_005069, partial [Pseudoalteromonas tetraodonis]
MPQLDLYRSQGEPTADDANRLIQIHKSDRRAAPRKAEEKACNYQAYVQYT